jgi:hypothetical protein
MIKYHFYLLFLHFYHPIKKSRITQSQATRLSSHPCQTRGVPPHVPVGAFSVKLPYIFSDKHINFEIV